ncbi:MAG: restriction endonuclease [Clostridia bacterium]|nr:restriction endonuclease [Clostridia bacterium]
MSFNKIPCFPKVTDILIEDNSKLKKPQLADYKLKQSDFKKLEDQQALCKKKQFEITRECENYNKIIYWVAAIPTIIIIFILLFFSKFCEAIDAQHPILLLILLFITVFAYPIFICKRYEKSPYSTPEYDKYNYVDKNLENRINQYNNAVKEYEEHCKRLQAAFWKNLTAFQFEREVAKLYEKLGYSASVTRATGDGGVDIILKKNNEIIAVQCKHHAKPVGPNDFRALIGTVVTQRFTKGIFVSLSGFTTGVYSEQETSSIKIELVDLNDLLKFESSVK